MLMCPRCGLSLNHLVKNRIREIAGITDMQREMLTLAFEGLTNREIAKAIRTTEQTVKNGFKRIYDVTGAGHRSELIVMIIFGSETAKPQT